MAWGGARTGAGRPKKPLQDKLNHDNPGKRPLTVVRFDEGKKDSRFQDENLNNRPGAPDFFAPDFLALGGLEAGDKVPSAVEIYSLLAAFVKTSGCENLVSPTLIEDFAHLRRSFLECEYINRTRGRVSGGKRSPYVTMAVDYNKQALSIYDRIWSIISQNSEQPYDGGKNEFLQLLRNKGF